MSSLIAIGYPNALAAENALAALRRAEQDQLIDLAEVAVVERLGGDRIKVHPGTGGLGRALLTPLLGRGTQAAGTGIDEAFTRGLGARLGPGNAALVALVRAAVWDRVLERLHGQYDGELLQTSLAPAQEAQLRAAAAAAREP